jgi:hypothetical protein
MAQTAIVTEVSPHLGCPSSRRRQPLLLCGRQSQPSGTISGLWCLSAVVRLHFPGERLVFCRQVEQRHTGFFIGDAGGHTPITIGPDEQVGGDVHERPNGDRRPQFEQARQFDHLTVREEQAVPETWDPVRYRERAKAWREKATVLPDDDPERAVCIVLAEGYDRLATLLEQRAGRPT